MPAPGQPGAGFFMPSRPSNVGGYVPIFPAHVPPPVWPPMASKRYFCVHGQQGRGEAKTQNLRKGHLQALHGVLCFGGIPVFPYTKTPYSGQHSATQGIKQPRPDPSGVSRGFVLYRCLQRVDLCPKCCNPIFDCVNSALFCQGQRRFSVSISPFIVVCRFCSTFTTR